MIIFDGVYSWKGRVNRQVRPIGGWASTYRLKIVDRDRQADGMFDLRPVTATIQDSGRGASVVNCLPEVTKPICAAFDLGLNRVVWVEETGDTGGRLRTLSCSQASFGRNDGSKMHATHRAGPARPSAEGF
jgi:hypothetical protein